MKVSLKKNIIASYFGQLYVVLLGILVMPFYISEMGAEAYGLVGFFAMLQAMFNLLDFGLTPTISRETARYCAGTHSSLLFSQLFRTLHIIFAVVALLGGGVLFLSAGLIAEKWLNIEALSVNEVFFALQVMAISVALRWMTGLYRGVVTGSEQIVWLSGFNASIATLRFLLVFPVMWQFGATPMVFFTYQLMLALLEFAVLAWKAYRLKPKLSASEKSSLVWSVKPVKSYIAFALSIAFTSGLWVVVTQTDKLIMSNLLSLEHYGYFTLAVLVASGIMLVSSPISGPIMPRMVKLEAEGKREELIKVYRNATQLITVIAGSVSIMIVFFSEPILWVWTGDKKIVETVAPVLQLYAVGYGLLAVGAFPYYLQYALGKLKLHVIGSIIFVSILLPILWFMTHLYGMLGAGYAWIIVNTLYFIGWTANVHRIYIPGLHWSWLNNGILKLLPLPILIAWAGSNLIVKSNRLVMLFELCMIGLLVLISAAVLSEKIKEKFKR